MKRYADAVSGGFMIVISIILLRETGRIQALGIMQFGPKVMPRIFAGVLFIVGCVITAQCFWNLRREKIPAERKNAVPVNRRRVVMTAGLITFYVFLLQPLGFIVTTLAYLILQFLVLGGPGKRQIPVYVVLSVLVTMGIYTLFYRVFDVFLPPGILY